MGRILRCVVAALAAVACQAWAQADANPQSLLVGLTQGSPQGQVPGAGGSTLTHAEVAQALQLATQQLALHGIVNPSADQIRIAMFGGTLLPPSGPAVLLPGVVQGDAATVLPDKESR